MLALILTAGCRSVEKMIDHGDYDAALLKSIRKISGKEGLKEKYVVAVEGALNKANNRDMDFIRQRFSSERASDWQQVIDHLRSIEKRQSAIDPLLPIISKDGRKANFTFIKTDELSKTAIEKFLTYTYRDGKQLLEKAREYDKAAARKAFSTFESLWKYTDVFRDAHLLQGEAEELGISRISVNIENATYTPIPDLLLSDLLALGFRDEQWIKYDFNGNIQFPDQEITVVLQDLEIEPEQINEKIYYDQKRIQDGFRYELDKNGNVKKDSLGNDIKIPEFKNIKARISHIQQLKHGYIGGYILNTNLSNGRVQQLPFDTHVVFEHNYAIFRGDRRALSEASKALMGTSPQPFPSDAQFVSDLVTNLKPVLKNSLRQLNVNG